ncbi:MAG: bifunctional copper resistance protein CopD/cytochrome c oxidase assembly protein [Microbacteriaceae bacterium]|nr:bifunctional copper resistance protein CopD/cytochrome c oxidase assembly protein [Microbacteriaceae bacterium]
MKRPRLIVALALVVAAIAGLWFAMELGGASHASGLGDTGDLVRWGAPILKMIASLAGGLVIGGLGVALFVLPPGTPANRTLNLILGAGIVWTLSLVVYIFFTYFTVVGTELSFDDGFDANFGFFLTETSLGRLLLTATGLSLVATTVVAIARRPFWLAVAFLVAVASAWPFAEMSHSGTMANHGLAINSLVLHIVFVSLWTGGLTTTVVAMAFGANRTDALRRYSSIALLSIAIVAITGTASAIIRIGTFDNLGSEYGILILVKATAVVILALLGARWRKAIIPHLDSTRGVAGFALLETAILGVVVGLATGLARTAPPIEQTLTGPVTPAEILTGRILPGEWTWTAAFTTWNIDLIWTLFAVFTSIFYLWGVERLRRRGDTWPTHRPIMWVGAMAILVYTTSGGVAVYGEFLFSAHMIEHMLLTMLIPVGIVLAAPVTLVARAIEVRHDGSRGMREWFLGIIHSKWIGFVGHPLVSTVVFGLSLMVFYYSPLLSWASTTHLGHEWMILHFLLAGYLFVQALIGVDPSPHRTSYPVRMILLMGTMGFHAFFGLSLMTGTSLLLPEWFGAMGRTWGDSPLVDQQVGGAIAWGIGELPTLILSAMVVLSWIRSDEREAKRSDRQAVRDHDAELEGYNAMLEKLEKRRPPNR